MNAGNGSFVYQRPLYTYSYLHIAGNAYVHDGKVINFEETGKTTNKINYAKSGSTHGNWEVIETITLSEPISELERTFTTQKYKEVGVVYLFNTSEATFSEIKLKIEFDKSGKDFRWFGSTTSMSQGRGGFSTVPQYAGGAIYSKRENGLARIHVDVPTTNPGYINYQSGDEGMAFMMIDNDAMINYLKLSINGGTFPTGTVIRIIGIKA